MTEQSPFLNDILKGLKSSPKYLPSKYFYDEEGDLLFQQIMGAPEYYLADCDLEIFSKQSSNLAKVLVNGDQNFDIIELGAGDAVKSTYLLKSLADSGKQFTYKPIDISSHIIELLTEELPNRVPGIKIEGFTGEYLAMLKQAYHDSSNKKLLLFLGSSIGNFELPDAKKFLSKIYEQMRADDLILIGFDLKKNPSQILAAYNDAAGFTKAFNLNLLRRMNNELGANFDLSAFEHFPTYNPVAGSCRSYLISTKKQRVSIAGSVEIAFEKNEPIDMELSQKFSETDIRALATELGFQSQSYFFDQREWYCNAVWKK